MMNWKGLGRKWSRLNWGTTAVFAGRIEELQGRTGISRSPGRDSNQILLEYKASELHLVLLKVLLNLFWLLSRYEPRIFSSGNLWKFRRHVLLPSSGLTWMFFSKIEKGFSKFLHKYTASTPKRLNFSKLLLWERKIQHTAPISQESGKYLFCILVTKWNL